MIMEGNTNIHNLCKTDSDTKYCVSQNPTVIDAQIQLLNLNSNSSYKVTNHYHSVGQNNAKFPEIDPNKHMIDTIADNY